MTLVGGRGRRGEGEGEGEGRGDGTELKNSQGRGSWAPAPLCPSPRSITTRSFLPWWIADHVTFKTTVEKVNTVSRFKITPICYL